MIHFIIPSIGRNTLQNTLNSVSGVVNSDSIVVFDGIEPTVESSNKIMTIKCDKKGVKNGNKAGLAGLVRNEALDFLSEKSHKDDWVAFVDDDDTIDPRTYSLLHTKYRPFDFIIFNIHGAAALHRP
jgi:glycosyltransferase involved in cell wall biosynthesis